MLDFGAVDDDAPLLASQRLAVDLPGGALALVAILVAAGRFRRMQEASGLEHFVSRHGPYIALSADLGQPFQQPGGNQRDVVVDAEGSHLQVRTGS